VSNLQVEDFPQAYRGLTLNGQRTAAGLLDKTVVDFVRVSRFDFSKLQIRDQRATRELGTGGDLGDAADTFRYLSLAGMVVGSTGEKLADMVSRIFQTFDVEEAQLASPTTRGLSDLTFTCPTEIAGYTPYQVEKFIARPAGYPVIHERQSEGLSRPFAVELVCEDPRRYRNAITTVTLNSGNSFSALCANWNALVGRQTMPLFTVSMAGAGSATFTLTDGARTFILDLSGMVNTDVVTVDMATGIIKKNGVLSAFLRTSPVDTFFGVGRGGTTITATNTTNVSSVAIAYYEARA